MCDGACASRPMHVAQLGVLIACCSIELIRCTLQAHQDVWAALGRLKDKSCPLVGVLVGREECSWVVHVASRFHFYVRWISSSELAGQPCSTHPAAVQQDNWMVWQTMRYNCPDSAYSGMLQSSIIEVGSIGSWLVE